MSPSGRDECVADAAAFAFPPAVVSRNVFGHIHATLLTTARGGDHRRGPVHGGRGLESSLAAVAGRPQPGDEPG